MPDNRTRQYLIGRSPKRGYDGEQVLPAGTFDDPTFVPRLSFKFTSAGPAWRTELSASIRDIDSSVSFFLDTNIWDKKLEDEIWDALLSRPDSVFVISSVRLELQKWIERNPDYIGSKAISDGHPNLMVYDLPPQDSDEITAYAYYIYLLQSRRRILDFYRLQFREKNGRDPSDDELMVGVQRTFGQRGLALVHKDGQSVPLDKWATDESLVYFAAAHALKTGRPTVVLTKDQDVLDQFYKLWWFLDTHYRAMLIANHYAQNRFKYPLKLLPDVKYIDDLFDRRNGVLVDLGPKRMNAYLPEKFSFVSAECWLIRNHMMRLTFGAETEMHRLLEVKGATGGLVSTQLEGRNLHPWLAPLPLPEHLRNCAAAVYDRTVTPPGSRAKVGTFDITHAVNTHERFTHLATEPGSHRTNLWTPGSSHVTSEVGLWTPRPLETYRFSSLLR